MPEEKQNPAEPAAPGSGDSRFPELEEMQREIEKRIRDNRRFLETFMEDDFSEEEGEEEEGGEEEFEEL